MKRSKKRMSARSELALALALAARDIAYAAGRAKARSDAECIPKSLPEKYQKGWGLMAAHGRAIMKILPNLPAEQWPETASVLCECADAIQGGTTLVSDVSIHDRRGYPNEKRRA